jgi:TRAP-type C4-dicarboxylate transport system permease small subunit
MKKMLDAFSRICVKILECIMVIMMTGMLILVGLNVLLRIFANDGIDFAEELPRFMFVWLIFCGAVIAMKERTHISVNLITSLSPKPLQKLFYIVTQALVLICGLYITYGTLQLHTIIYENSSPVLQISTLWVFGVTYIAGPGLTLIALTNLIRLALGRVTDLELKGMDEAYEAAMIAEAEAELKGGRE